MPNGRQPRRQVFSQRQSIKTDDGKILAHRASGILCSPHGAYCHHIRYGIGSGDLRVLLQYMVHSLVALFIAEARLAILHQVFGRQSALDKGRPSPGKALAGNIAEAGPPANNGNVPVSILQQHSHRLHRGLKVIGRHTGKVRVVQPFGRGGHQHRRQRNAPKAPLKVISIAAQE